jgi:multidrug transporter EmrE-like cation transporter
MRHGPWYLWGRFPTFTCDVPFFKERMTAWKALGLLAAIAAVLVLSSALPLPWGL